MSNETDSLTYERAVDVLRYCAETGVLERKLKNGEWRVCGHRPICKGYGMVRVDGKNYQTHRLIWLLVHGAWPESDLDHLDRNPINNKIENLREVSTAENQQNAGLRSDNSSGFIGVCFHKRVNKFQAEIKAIGKRIHLGYYNTASEAFTAYMAAKIHYHPSSPDAQQYLKELTIAG